MLPADGPERRALQQLMIDALVSAVPVERQGGINAAFLGAGVVGAYDALREGLAVSPVEGTDGGRPAFEALCRLAEDLGETLNQDHGNYPAYSSIMDAIGLAQTEASTAPVVGTDDEPAAWPDGMYETAAMALYRARNPSFGHVPWRDLENHKREAYRGEAHAVVNDLTEHLRYLMRPEPDPVGQTVTDEMAEAASRCAWPNVWAVVASEDDRDGLTEAGRQVLEAGLAAAPDTTTGQKEGR